MTQTLLTFLLYVICRRGELIYSSNFSLRGSLPLIRKDFSRKLCRCLSIFSIGFTSFSVVLLFPQSALLHSMSYFFFLFRSLSSSLCTVFDAMSSNIDEALSINPSLNVFVFGDFDVYHKDWLTYSGVRTLL